MTRILDAPPDQVFTARTAPRHAAQWWGPKDFINPPCEMDVRPGGALTHRARRLSLGIVILAGRRHRLAATLGQA